jgi:hypothetical protein
MPPQPGMTHAYRSAHPESDLDVALVNGNVVPPGPREHSLSNQMSTAAQNPTVPAGENPTNQRGDEPQFVETS